MLNIEKFVKENIILDSDDKIIIKELWDNRYRVNIWKHDPNRIVQSYFVKVTPSGIESNPNIGA